ncbi:MAG TPA: hypothetical protein VLB01_07195 [Thermodesulfobacteriota bacterium]|nr:hypothetical protein [Thermodesulfobacteriota bacterium]
MYENLKWCIPYILPLKNLLIPLVILRGETRANRRPGALLFAGNEHRTKYISDRFFESKPDRENLCDVFLWNLAPTLKRLRSSADLTVVHIDRFSARVFFDADYLVVPEWVGSMLNVQGNPGNIASRNHTLKDALRIVRRNKLSHEISRAETDFEQFYHTMYVPFIRSRHGERAVVRDFYQMRRAFHQGGLIWVLRGKERISGQLFRRQNQVLQVLALGTAKGDLTPIKDGAGTALDLFTINHAKELGCKFIEFGGSRPCLTDGLLRYKRKWGMSLTEQHSFRYDFLIHWNKFDGMLTSFFANTPLIFRKKDGFAAICVISQDEAVDQIQAMKVQTSMWMAGLQELYLISTSGWQPGISSPPQTKLINLKNFNGLTPSTLK